jgi:hypothetical protein
MDYSNSISKTILLLICVCLILFSSAFGKVHPKYVEIGTALISPHTPFSSIFKWSNEKDGEYWREIGAKAYFAYTKRFSFSLSIGYVKKDVWYHYNDSPWLTGFVFRRDQRYFIALPSWYLSNISGPI